MNKQKKPVEQEEKQGEEVIEKVKEKTCFIITPIGHNNSPIRREIEGVYDEAIIPTLKELGFSEEEICMAHKIDESGSINNQIINKIANSDLVIANLSDLNPNVMYELAIRHAVRKPVVTICRNGTTLPFDLTTERTIFYENDFSGLTELKLELSKKCKSALKCRDNEIDNPIFSALKVGKLFEDLGSTEKTSKTGEPELLKYMLGILEDIKRNTNNRSRPRSVPSHNQLELGSTKTYFLEPYIDIRKMPVTKDIELVCYGIEPENVQRISKKLEKRINEPVYLSKLEDAMMVSNTSRTEAEMASLLKNILEELKISASII